MVRMGLQSDPIDPTKTRLKFHDLSFRVWYLRGWKSCTFSFVTVFVAKTQNPSNYDPRLEEFTIPSSDDFVADDKDELLVCPIRARRKYLSHIEQYHPELSNLFFSATKRKKWRSRNTVRFGLDRSSAMHMGLLPSQEDCYFIAVLEELYNQQVLKAGT